MDIFEPDVEGRKARVFLAKTLRHDDWQAYLSRLAGGLGLEPRLAESESAVLPLDDPPTVRSEAAS